MALVKNIAGFEQRMGAADLTADGGRSLLQNLVKFSPEAQKKYDVAASDPLVMAVKLGVNLIPEGSFKKWVTMNPLQLYTKLFQAVFGRKYTTGQYRLGERLMDQVNPQGSANQVVSYRDVKDEVVNNAITLFTIFFGVRISTQEDLDALEMGSTAYYLRPDKTDIPSAAVARAVYLKQTYFSDSTYNTAKWDMDIFSRYPLAAPIPDPYNVGSLYTGPLPGGGFAKNGMVEVDEVLGGTPTAGGGSGTSDTESKNGGGNWWVWLLLLGGGYALSQNKIRL